jgi:hypothetical protein
MVNKEKTRLKLYVEGGGDTNYLKTECRKAFTAFLTKAGLAGNLPRIVACGGRQKAYNDFCTALKNGNPALLLVDSEELVDANHMNKPWHHLAARKGDEWATPEGAQDSHCHLMVVCMDSWFLADQEQLCRYFGQGFKEKALPSSQKPVETITKEDIYEGLKNATCACKTKSGYDKGTHSFEILAQIDPHKVIKASPWAARLIEGLKPELK